MLGDLFDRYGSDKNRAHSYGPFYDELFSPIREKVTALLEVGIAHGASLRAWQYYFPNAKIWGLDHHADLISDDRIVCVRANSTIMEELNEALKDETFDIIVDDGCHWYDEQTQTWRNLFHRVRPGGLYVVEDIQGDEGLAGFAELGAEIFNRREIKNRGDDVLAVFRKPLE